MVVNAKTFVTGTGQVVDCELSIWTWYYYSFNVRLNLRHAHGSDEGELDFIKNFEVIFLVGQT